MYRSSTVHPVTAAAGTSGRRPARKLMAALGILCVTLGTAGIFIPGLPTTVFLLAASWLFSKSSPRLHGWIRSHARLGRFLTAAETGEMPLRAKVISLIGICGGIGMAFHALRPEGAVSAILIGAALMGTTAVLVLPGLVRRRAQGSFR